MTYTGDIGVIVTSVAGLLGVLGNLYVQMKNAKTLASNAELLRLQAIQTTVTANKVDTVVAKVEEVHRATNSLTDKLVASTASASHQEGVTAGVAMEKERAANGVPTDTQPPTAGTSPP